MLHTTLFIFFAHGAIKRAQRTTKTERGGSLEIALQVLLSAPGRYSSPHPLIHVCRMPVLNNSSEETSLLSSYLIGSHLPVSRFAEFLPLKAKALT